MGMMARRASFLAQPRTKPHFCTLNRIQRIQAIQAKRRSEPRLGTHFHTRWGPG